MYLQPELVGAAGRAGQQAQLLVQVGLQLLEELGLGGGVRSDGGRWRMLGALLGQGEAGWSLLDGLGGPGLQLAGEAVLSCCYQSWMIHSPAAPSCERGAAGAAVAIWKDACKRQSSYLATHAYRYTRAFLLCMRTTARPQAALTLVGVAAELASRPPFCFQLRYYDDRVLPVHIRT